MKNLFTNDKFFLLTVIMALIGEFVFAIIDIFVWKTASISTISLLLALLCVPVLYVSYKKHDKNIMKAVMGALLMALVITGISLLWTMDSVILQVCYPVFAVLAAVLFINHFVINNSRKAHPAEVALNQFILTALIIVNIVASASIMANNPDAVTIVAGIMNIFGFAGISTSVVCVESRLDAYRLNRENAGWTENIGYPEGYEHGKEKK